MRRCAVLAIVLLVAACGGSPAAPTPQPAKADFFASGAVAWDCRATATPTCSFTAQAHNTGTGCANGLHGTFELVKTGTVLGQAEWAYGGTVQGGQTVTFTGCCINYDVGALAPYTWTSTFQWTDAPCS